MSGLYPEPPWDTHGFAVFCPYLVPRSAVVAPAPLEPVSIAGVCNGVLAYVEYRAPSPLEYSELIWMPAMTRASGVRGYHVAVMYVDSEASLAGGRELWALPKTLARFSRTADGVDVQADDGTELSLRFRAHGPRLPGRGRIATLQCEPGGLVRFRGDSTGRVRLATARVVRLATEHVPWDSFRAARPAARLAAILSPFHSIMQPPVRIPSMLAGSVSEK